MCFFLEKNVQFFVFLIYDDFLTNAGKFVFEIEHKIVPKFILEKMLEIVLWQKPC